MKKPLLPVFLILLLGGLLSWREARQGALRPLDARLAGWAAVAAGTAAHGFPRTTIVLQGGAGGGELGALDIALFARAASRLGAAVAGVPVYQFPASNLSLDFSAAGASGTRLVAGCLLLPGPAREGIPPVRLEQAPGGLDRVETFRGYYSTFSAGRGWSAGFLNLPGGSSFGASALVVASLNASPSASFPLVVILEAMRLPPEHLRSSGNALKLANLQLPLKSDGSVELLPQSMQNLARLDMDDLLLEAERRDQDQPENSDIADLVRDRILLFGSLDSDPDAALRLGSGRRLSMVEFQALAVDAILAALRLPSAPWWIEPLALLGAIMAGLSLWRLSPSDAVILALAVLAGWLLFGLSLVAQTGAAPPVVSPMLVLVLAAALRFLLKNHGQDPSKDIDFRSRPEGGANLRDG